MKPLDRKAATTRLSKLRKRICHAEAVLRDLKDEFDQLAALCRREVRPWHEYDPRINDDAKFDKVPECLDGGRHRKTG